MLQGEEFKAVWFFLAVVHSLRLALRDFLFLLIQRSWQDFKILRDLLVLRRVILVLWGYDLRVWTRVVAGLIILSH